MRGSTADIVPILREITIEAVQIVHIAADKLAKLSPPHTHCDENFKWEKKHNT